MDSGYQYIGVPQGVWNDINITNYDFFCYNSTNCYTLQNCSVVAAQMDPLTVTILGDSASGFSDFTIELSPEFYLWQNTSTGYCDFIIQPSTDATYQYVFGQPFFRQYTIMMNYTSNQIGVIDNDASSPVVMIDTYPTANTSWNANSTLAVDSTNENYYGSIAIGAASALQTNTMVAVDLQEYVTVLPSINCTTCGAAWFLDNDTSLLVE